MKIFVDFDNTLVDSVLAFVTRHNMLYGTRFASSSVTTYEFKNLNVTEEEIIHGFESRCFFGELTLYKGAKDALIKLQEAGATLVLVTRGTLANTQLKIEWLNSHHWIKDLFSDFIFLTSNQDAIKIDMSDSILIDDYRINHVNSNAKYKYAFKDQAQRTWYPSQDDGVKVFNSWSQLAEDIRTILVTKAKDISKTNNKPLKQSVEKKSNSRNRYRKKHNTRNNSSDNKNVNKKNTKQKGGD